METKILDAFALMAFFHDERGAETVENLIQSMAIETIDPDWALTRQAAIYKAKGNISYADCFAAALAKLHGAALVTGDKEFKQLENEIAIEWLK